MFCSQPNLLYKNIRIKVSGNSSLMLKNICETMQKRIKEMGQHQILCIMKIHINIVVDETKRIWCLFNF